MQENPRKMRPGGTDIPLTISWHGAVPLRLTKEEAAKRRPSNSSSIPISIDWLKDPTRHIPKAKSINAGSTPREDTRALKRR